ncbi:MAG: hypothetical protein ACRDQD_22205, partial [Nocardioidaceae bacterium]
TGTGWGPQRIARAWITLMQRLGYTKFAAQGGDWGAVITDVMATQGDPALIGIHTNMPNGVPAELDAAARAFAASARDEEALALQIPSDGDVQSLRAVLDHLEVASINVDALSVHTPDLDDVFLALTGRTAEDGNDPSTETQKETAR